MLTSRGVMPCEWEQHTLQTWVRFMCHLKLAKLSITCCQLVSLVVEVKWNMFTGALYSLKYQSLFCTVPYREYSGLFFSVIKLSKISKYRYFFNATYLKWYNICILQYQKYWSCKRKKQIYNQNSTQGCTSTVCRLTACLNCKSVTQIH